MNAMVAFVHLTFLLCTVSSCVLAKQGLDLSESCLAAKEKAKWTRSLHFNNKSFSLNIEVNDKPSHWIINYIFEILIRERFGYRNINFIYTPWDSSSNAINRLNCEKSNDCSCPPPIHVNLELWLRTGEQVSDYAPPHRVNMNGPLGPITRWGLYTNEELLGRQAPLFMVTGGKEEWPPLLCVTMNSPATTPKYLGLLILYMHLYQLIRRRFSYLIKIRVSAGQAANQFGLPNGSALCAEKLYWKEWGKRVYGGQLIVVVRYDKTSPLKFYRSFIITSERSAEDKGHTNWFADLPVGAIEQACAHTSTDELAAFIYTRRNLSTDPRISQDVHPSQSFGEGVLFYDRPSMLKAYKTLLLEDGMSMEMHVEQRPTQFLWNLTTQAPRFPILLNWYPNTLTLKSRLVRLGVPDCVALRARTPVDSSVDSTCAFEVNQLVKVSWAGLAEAAPLVTQLINRFHIKQTDYIQLLRRVSPNLLNYTDAIERGEEKQFRARFRETACWWLRMHRSRWEQWTEGWNVKKEIIIGGMFTFAGTEEFKDLAPNAFHAVDVLNGDEKYFGNSEFAIRLQIRNLTCSQNVVLNDFFNFLTVNPNNESILGVILALCPDAIEATVRLANLRRVLVISPTVESASFLWQKHYKFFFRTIPSAYTASFIFIRLFQQWRWKRVAMFRKDDHYFYRDAFTANNITLVDDFEVKESMLTYANVISVKQRNGRIIIVDHSAGATAIILCAAFHLNMRAEEGYVWFLSPWLSKNFWESPEVIPPECSANDLKVMHDYSFSVSHPLHTGAVIYSNLMTSMSGPNQSEASSGSKPDMRIRSHQRQLYEQCTFESVIVLGSAIARLLRENPSALSILSNPKMAERLRTLVSKTHMEYSSRGYLDKNAVSFFSNNVDQLGETLVYQFGVTPPSPPVPPQTPPPAYDEDPLASTVHQLSFDSHNDRLLEAWLLKQIQDKTTVPITLWSFSGPLHGDEDGESTLLSKDRFRLHSSSGYSSSSSRGAWGGDMENGEEGEENGAEDNRNDAIAFKTFVDNLFEKPYDKPRWGGSGSLRPTDGSITEADCAFSFLSRWFGVSCVVGNWIFAMGVLIIIAIPVVAVVLAYFRRRLREAEKLTRKPYEELCALLADVNIPLTDIVINRRIGDGAFGLVYGGEAKFAGRWEAVAVKMNTNRTTYEAKVEFLSEAKLMRDLRHKNVVRLVGVCMDRPQDEIYLIMELMLLGDLKKYLLERRLTAQRCPDHEDICPATLTRMALDIAEGLAYLHSKQLIHRDIACRNCLVGPDHVVKIGDFGLTREATAGSPYGYYRFTRNVELPIRWMPPEAVQFGIFSVKSDLWSYGIVLYEIITFGMFPYAELGDVEVVERVKRSEFSITQILPPAANGTTVWRLIVSCCQYYWQHRPESMLQVIEEIRANENCIRPYLTDEPPTLETTAIPFLPGPGACIMPEPPPVPQPAFSAPMGARAWVGGAPFMNPSTPFTEPPSAGEGPQRHTAANSSSGGCGGGGGCSEKVYFSSANSSSSLTSNSASSRRPHNTALNIGQTPVKRAPPPTSVYAPPGHPGYQPSDELNPLLNPSNRSMSLEFLQKSDFHLQTPPSRRANESDVEEELERISESGDVDLRREVEDEEGEVDFQGRRTKHQRTSRPQKPSLLGRSPFSFSVDPSGGTRRQQQHSGNFFARTFAAALDPRGGAGKSHPRRPVGLASFLHSDQSSSIRMRLLPSLRHHNQQHHFHQTAAAVASSPPSSSRNELTAKSLPQVSGTNCHTSTVVSITKTSRRGACSSAGDAHYLARPRPPTTAAFSTSASRSSSAAVAVGSPRGQRLPIVTQNGAAGLITSSGSSPTFSYPSPPPPPPHNSFV
ncbi:ALK tyrosine kinase receptor [Echinococcus granulosus]|uniref:ALK tyrosine kinase receptor n=1 Tax=Echinococcus granulosus TaxID=6210 RepID=W6UMB1_ECHGR|nr:ALK tyrosine kinase receptor [Echinococcus granulosus]EUB62276.1 ALK tyrosine kinase receptor [Echinococcus granulosus]